MKTTKKKRALSLLLCAALLFSQIGVTAHAEGAETGGLCEHHPVHTAECGYTEPEQGTPCNHEHRSDCYRLAEKCVHEHTPDCYPEDEETDGTATPSDADKREPTECGHVCSEETGCVKEVLDCPHEHKVNGGEADREGGLGRDADCGYVEAVEGHPCGYVCEICNAPEDSGTPSDATKAVCICIERCGTETVNPDCPICKDDPKQCAVPAADNGLTVTITGWEWIDPDENLNQGALALPGVSKEDPMSLDGIVSMLPEQISATVNGGDEPEKITLDGWVCGAFKQDDVNGDWPVQGEYAFAAALPEGYELDTDAKPLEVKVTLGGGNTLENSTGDFIVTGGELDTDYSYAENTLTIKSSTAITISGTTTTDKVVVENGVTANITLDDVSIDVHRTNGTCAFEVAGNATCNLTLTGENTLRSGNGKAGLQVQDKDGAKATLTITAESDGSLTAKSSGYTDGYGAGIGGGSSGAGGNITIAGGNVTATGGKDGAGIGGGGSIGGASGEITISGGTVNAYGANSAAGIGGGGGGWGNGASNKITISDGNVTARGGSDGGAGIGSGKGGTSGEITISGGTVNTTGSGGSNGSAGIGGGTYSAGGEITISGGNVTTTGGTGSAGIGGGRVGAGGTIIIKGGIVTANGSGGGAGIGGGDNNGAGGAIIISGGTVTASSNNGAGIGGGSNGASGSFSTTLNGNQGNAFIVTSSISDNDNTSGWSGVIFEGDTGKVYGSSITLDTDAEIPSGKTLTVGNGSTLTLGTGVTLTNNGTITVEMGGELAVGNGLLNNFGTLDGTGTKPNDADYNNKKSTVTLSASPTPATYNGSVTLTATIAEQLTHALSRSIQQKTVIFYCGDTEIGRETVSGSEVTKTITLTGENWKPGNYSFHTEYTGGNDQLLPASSNTLTLTVDKASQMPTSVVVSQNTVTYGGTAPTITALTVADSADVTYSVVSNTTGFGDTTDVASISGTTITLKKAGTFYVKAVISATDYYNEKTVYSNAITVNKADSEFTSIVKKDGTETSNFTYGDTITVEISDIQVKSTGRNALSQNYVYLFAADPSGSPDTSSAIASAAVSNGKATLTYDTSGKGVAVGNSQTLWIAYGGSGDLNPATQTVSVELAVKPLTGAVDSDDSSAAKRYDGNTNFSDVKLALNGTVGGDTVTATATGTADDSNVGDSKAFTAASVTLDGAEKGWYSLATGGVSGNVKITKAEGSLSISCSDITYGTQVTPSVTDNTGGGTVTYSYTGLAGTTYGPSTTAPINVGKYTVTGTAAATANHQEATATANFEITKATGAAISTVTGSYTGDGSTFTYTVTPINGAEYSKDNSAWQDSSVFTGFTTSSGATTFYARMKADNNHNAGASSNTGAVTFSKLEKTENPALSYQISGATGSKQITITTVSGCEYTFDDGASWGNTNTHTFITDGQPVIGIRFAETATHNASAGAKQTVDLANQEQAAPGAFTLTFSDNGDGTFTATIPTVSGGEYSFDGASWNGTNTKADCQPNTSYTGYVRLAAKDGYNASPATTDTKTTPKLIVTDPVITPNSGSFTGSQSVTITTTTPDAKIYYTTDGSSPSGASTAYTGAFTLTDSATVQAIALKDGYESSGVIKAVFTKQSNSGGTGGGNSGGSSSGGDSGNSNNSGSGQTGVTTPAKPDAPTTGTITTIPGKPDQNGSVSIPGEKVTNAINDAVKAAEKNGQTKNGVAIAVNLPAGTTSATLDRAALDRLIASGVKNFKLDFNGVALTFDLPALKEIAGKTTGTLTFGASKATGLTGASLTAIGTRPVYNLTVSWQANGKTAYLDSFGAGRVSVAMAYTPAANELTGSLYAVYVNGSGKVEWIDQSSYDRNSKAVIFQTGHFSTYGVGYKAPPAFTDTVNHWAKADIDFAVSRGLLSGTSETTFAPNGPITRGMFVTALGRLAGIDPDSYKTNKFTDVKADAYYAPYVNWAAEKGIVSGTGDTTFAPDQTVTRQEMAVIMENYAKIMGYTVPKTREAVTFTDSGSIAGWAKDAVRAMQMAGVINGKDGNRFDPTGTATRAEAAAVLRRFVEIVIDPATAGGWTQNDSGAWLYYQNGKPVTGWKQLENHWYYFDTSGIMQTGDWRQIGGKWYYFYPTGIMAVNAKIDGYEVGADGARKKS